MKIRDIWKLIDQNKELNPNGYQTTYKDIKEVIFADDLRGKAAIK